MYRVKREQENEKLWLQGLYIQQAVASCFDGKKNPYPKKPIPITREAIERTEEEERQEQIEAARAKMQAVMSAMNRKRKEAEKTLSRSEEQDTAQEDPS